MDVLIDWKPIVCEDCPTCICSSLVEYREQGSDVWVVPTYPANPTQAGEYLLSGIEVNIYYQVRLTHIGPMCKSAVSLLTMYYPSSQCCEDGFTLSPDGTSCIKVEDVPATPPSGPTVNLGFAQNFPYSTCGSYIYNMGYNINGTGASTQIPVIADPIGGGTSNLWINPSTIPCGDGTSNLGPLNRTGVWISPIANNQDVGFSRCVEASEEKIYYIGVGADNSVRISVDGVLVLNQDQAAISGQYGVGLAATFKVWHIYPIMLTAGPHIVQIIGHNDSGAAGMGCEIYNATADELRAMTNVSQLTPRTIFSSSTQRGQAVQIGTGVGYTCPSDYLLAPCEDPVVCRKITLAPVQNC